MRSITNIAGILLIIAGIILLGYRGYTYTSQEKIAEIGNVKITAEHDNTVYFSPMLGGVIVVAGVVLVIAARIGRQ